MAIWRAFVVAALLPLAVLLIFTRALGEPQPLIWRVAVTALIVYSLRNAILRSREFDADARAHQLDPGTALGTVLAGLPARTGRWAWHLGWTHPSGQERAAALLDPAPLYRFGFWDGLAVGLVAALGASATHAIVTLLTTDIGVRYVVMAIIFAAFAGPAVAVAMWRRQLVEADPGVVKGWAAGPGLGLGLALGPVIALSAAYTQALAPDHLNPAAVGVLAVWTGLVIVIFTPFPVWVGHWADAWQQRADPTASRVPARGAMIAAAVAAWIVMAVGLFLLLETFTFLFWWSSAAAAWHQLPDSLRGTAIVVTLQGAGWGVCLLVAGMPLAAALAYRRWRRPGDAHDAAVRSRRWLATALLCFAGCLTAVALTLAVSAVTHARIAGPVRWSPYFVSRLFFFDEQAIVVVAVVCAVIAAARARSAAGVALSAVVAAAAAAAGGLALLRLGAHPAVLDGAPGLLVTRSGLPGGMLEQWFIVRGPVVHVVTLYRSPAWGQDSPYLRRAFAWMLRTWQWTNPAKGSPTASSRLDPGSLTGTWTGSYTCPQGQGKTGLRLVIHAAPDGTLTATVDFYAIPGNPGVPSGSFTMTGTYSTAGLDLRPGHWISRPPGYSMVSLNAGPPAKGDTVLNGNVSHLGCTTFTVTRSNTAT